MKQFFECTNFKCSHKTQEYGNMRMRDLYVQIEANKDALVTTSSGETVVTCPECFAEMVYVSMSGEPENHGKYKSLDLSKIPEDKDEETTLINSFYVFLDMMSKEQQELLKSHYGKYVDSQREKGEKALPAYLYALNYLKDKMYAVFGCD